MVKKLFILFFNLFLVSDCFSQSSYHITTNQGLGTNMLSTIIKDHNNYMWICSYNGLFKHEGSGIKIFKKNIDTLKSVSANEMHGIYEDKYGFIWGGSTAGVNKINPITGEVQQYYIKNPDSSSSHVGYIYSIFQDDKDYIWVVTDEAIFKMNYKTGVFTAVPKSKDENGIYSINLGYRPTVTTSKGMWMCTGDGLVFYDYKTEKFFHKYNNPLQKPIFNMPAPFNWSNGNGVELTIDSKKNLYFITGDNYLGRYNIVTEKLDSFKFEYPKDTWKCCISLATDERENIWIGFRHGGILVFDKDNLSFTAIKKQPINSLISSNYISSICKDYKGKMWVTTDNGIHVIDLYNNAVKEITLSNEPAFEEVKYESGIISIDKNNNIYIPYFKGGIFSFNANNYSTQYISTSDSLIYKTTYVYPDDNNNTWLAAKKTLTNKALNAGKSNLQNIFPLADSLSTTSGNAVWMFKAPDNSYYIKKANGWWIQLTKNRLNTFKGEGFMKQGCVSKDNSALWYISPELNLIKRNFKTLQHDTINLQVLLKKSSFYFSNPRDMVDDGDGSIWITSQNGLLRYNNTTKKIITYTTADGLSHSFTHGLFADKQNNVWVLSLGGIDCYIKKNNGFIKISSFASGKYMEGFGSIVNTSDGRICFVKGSKIIIVNPALLFEPDKNKAILRLHELKINSENVDFNDANLLMNLHWKKNRLLFRFGLLEFVQQDQITYAYKLNGLNNNWVSLDNRSEVQFDGLPSGKYNLVLKATSATNEEYLYSITFKIIPPWWQTWLFKIFALCVIGAIVYFLFRRHIKQIRKKADIKQQLVELEAKALRAQMNPHFIFNSLNAIQELIVTENMEDGYRYLSSFSKLLRMVLNYSDKNFITLTNELEVLKLYLSLEALRFRQSFNYNISIDENIETDIIQLPSLLLQPYVENAVWHGLRHKEGEKALAIFITEKGEQLEIIIQDNGVGRERSEAIKSQKLGVEKFESKGTLLATQRISILNQQYPGMATTKTIDLKDSEGKGIGTKVIITLPIIQQNK